MSFGEDYDGQGKSMEEEVDGTIKALGCVLLLLLGFGAAFTVFTAWLLL